MKEIAVEQWFPLCRQGIGGYMSVVANLKFTYFFN